MRQLHHTGSGSSLCSWLACLCLVSAPLESAADSLREEAAANLSDPENAAAGVSIVKKVSPAQPAVRQPGTKAGHKSGSPARRRHAPAPIPITRQQLLSPPEESIRPALAPLGNDLPPPSPLPVEYAYQKTKPHVTAEGLIIGNYVLSPRIYFSTDNRYDDANVRERALREDIEVFEARRRGELREDPISKMFHDWQRDPLNITEPSFQLMGSIHALLQSALHTPILTLRPDLFLQRRTELVTNPLTLSAPDQATPQTTRTTTPSPSSPPERTGAQPQSIPTMPSQPGLPQRTAP